MDSHSLVRLRVVHQSDLDIFYHHQAEPAATAMARFPARDYPSHMQHWQRNLANPDNIHRTILYNGQVAGNIVSFLIDNERYIGYWLGSGFWGKGITTAALLLFLDLVTHRPLYAYVASGNIASRRVLEKCSFIRCDRAADSASEYRFVLPVSAAAESQHVQKEQSL